MMQSLKHNFNDGLTLEVRKSEWQEGNYIVSVSTREGYVSKPELESLRDSLNEMLGDDDGQDREDGESSLPQGDDKESVEALLSEADSGSSKPRS